MKWSTRLRDRRSNVSPSMSRSSLSEPVPIDHSTKPQFEPALQQAEEDLRKIRQEHQTDLNLPQEEVDFLKDAVKTGAAEKVLQVEHDFVEESPYESVRAAVRNTDGEEPANTLRAWILGFLFVTVAAAVNMFLSMRSPAISIATVVLLLLVHPVGLFWARIMPTRKFNTFGIVWSFNPGPWNIKEHTVVTLMANVTYGYAYSTDALLALQAKPLYNYDLGWGFALIFTLTSQIIGISVAGLCRRFLTWPAALLWPANFSITTLLYALHDSNKPDPSQTNGWRISSYRYFLYVTLGAFVWYWFPGVIFQSLSVFSFVTWIRPQNAVLNQLFGGFTGLSLIPLTFDWTYVSAYLQDPLLSPTFSHVNVGLGLIIFVIISTIGISYTNSLYTAYLPINTNTLFDNTQSVYDVQRIIGPGFTFDLEKYKKYSPIFLTPTFYLNYGLSFAALTASIVHTILYHGKEVWYRYRTSRNQEADIHMNLMRKYKEAPDWWYAVLFVISTLLGLAVVLGYPSQISWDPSALLVSLKRFGSVFVLTLQRWAYFVSIIVALFFTIPTCMILGIANIQLSLNVIGPFLGGLMMPGKPIAVMIFKVYSTIALGQAQTYAQDLKLAHYMKIPPRITFSCQVAASIWAVFVQIATMNWTLGNIPDVCTPTQSSHFTCPNGRTFFSSSIVWGLIGPVRMFGAGSFYNSLNYFWLLGGLLPVAFYALARIFPSRYMRYLHAPIMGEYESLVPSSAIARYFHVLGGMAWLPPATPLSFSSWAIVGLIFNFWIRKRYSGWWSNYNYITAAALDAGLIISTIIIFFAITLPEVTVPQWWGNVNVFETMDALGTAIRKTVATGETFGPKP